MIMQSWLRHHAYVGEKNEKEEYNSTSMRQQLWSIIPRVLVRFLASEFLTPSPSGHPSNLTGPSVPLYYKGILYCTMSLSRLQQFTSVQPINHDG